MQLRTHTEQASGSGVEFVRAEAALTTRAPDHRAERRQPVSPQRAERQAAGSSRNGTRDGGESERGAAGTDGRRGGKQHGGESMQPHRRESSERSLGGSIQEARPNQAVLVTAARLRFGLNVNGLVWAAARDGER